VIPIGFTQRMTQLLDKEAEKFLSALTQPAITGIRVNTLKINSSSFETLLKEFLPAASLEPVPWCPSGFVLESNTLSGKHPFHAAGLFYFQEPSAMSVAKALNPKPGELIIDLAASPGGKTTHLVSLSQNQSVVIANEINRSRVKALSENLERWGAHRAVITNEAIEHLSQWHGGADRVLLDAPCSGEGMFRKSKDALEMWSEATILGCAKRQQSLLDEAAKLVKPGGHLVYSTCTFAPEENEWVIGKFLQIHPAFELKECRLEGSSSGGSEWLPEHLKQDMSKAKRFWPHKIQGEGHFVALLQKTDGEERKLKPASFHVINKHLEQLWHDFCQQTFGKLIFQKPLTLFGDKLFMVDERIPDIKGLNVFRTGLWLGTLLKNRFEPSHSLALALSKDDLNQANTVHLEPDSSELKRYLQGHPLEHPGEKGWVLITVRGFPIGWGKRSGNVINNAYPKGLRLS
jgi:NOL1/NOP2/sun family putative RNA methylase